jgi:hypothetical protein
MLSVAALLAVGGLALAGLRCSAKSALGNRPPAEAPLPPVPVGPAKLELRRADTGHSRILLDDATKAALRASAERRTPAFESAAARCEALIAKPVPAGYEAFNWANAVAALSLCWHSTADDRYAAGAIGYLTALLDDRYKVGDGRGGDSVVHHDSGYGIRTFGAYSALGYDWLRKAPGMTPELKRRIAERLRAWLDWYGEKGYLREHPIANYFWGYLTTLSFAGLAFHGEVPEAKAWLERSRELFGRRVLPTFKAKLRGGYWPEGWQYGEYTALEIAFVARAFKSAVGIDLVTALPWLRDTVNYHVHALSPDRSSVYDGGTWSAHPTKPSALGMSAVALALTGVDDQRASVARWLVRRALPPLDRDLAWLGLLTDQPGAPEKDPHRTSPTSFHPPGSSVTFMRSDWSKSAVWVSFQAGPRLAEDHQHKDEGHFGLWRGSDALLVDGGGSEGDATINHNTILIDDGGRLLTYTPNQGVFGREVRTTRFGDDGQVVVVAGDIADAYAPVCARDGCSDRALSKLVRTLVYVRPSVLLVHDDIHLKEKGDGTIWAAHTTVTPTVHGSRVSAVVGASRVDIQSLWPEGARTEVLKEPTPSGEGVHRKNQPWGPMWRIETSAPRDSTERVFLQYISADAAEAQSAPVQRLTGRGLIGARGTLESKAHAVVFASSDRGGEVSLGAGVQWVAVVGLPPGRRYRARATAHRNCAFELRAAHDGNVQVNGGGFVRMNLPECGPRP